MRELPNTVEERLKETFFLVECEDTFPLWKDYSPESDFPRYPVKSWEQVMQGNAVTVGYLTTFKKASDIAPNSKVKIVREGLTNGLEGEVEEWEDPIKKWRVSFDEEYQGWYFPEELAAKDEYERRPIVISLNWAMIDGQLVCFWHGCSQLVDYRMINEWLNKNFDGTHDGGRRSATDSMNFHNCIGAIKRKNEE
jgi:hypothetical protein